MIKWTELTDGRSIRCLLGLHRLTKRERASGWAMFDHVIRYRCRCGRWEWVRFNGRIVSRQDGRGDVPVFNVQSRRDRGE